MKLWLEITKDELELPLAVACSCKELADLRGVPYTNIQSMEYRWRAGEIKRCKYISVEVDENEEG